MSSATQSRPNWWAPAIFGAWAAAIGVARSPVNKLLLLVPALCAALGWWILQNPVRWLALFFATALLLPPLPIPIGDSGPHVSMLFAAIGIFGGVLWLRDWQIVPRTLNAAFVLLTGAMFCSIASAALYSGVIVAAGSAVRVVLFGISVYIFFYGAYGPGREANAHRSTRLLYWAAAASALFACIDFYFQFPAPAGYGPQFVWLDSGVYRRAQGLFYEASTLGNFCTFFLVMIAVAFTRPRRESPVSRIALIAGGAAFFAALVLSYSRGSLINLAVALSVLAWYNRSRLPIIRITALLAAAALLTWWIFPSFAEMYWLRISFSAEYLFTRTEGVLSGRIASWQAIASWVAAHPWQAMFGIGYKTLPYTSFLGAPVVADNMYLSLLVETGVIGMTALVWLNFAILRATARRARHSFFAMWMLCFWAGQTVQLASGDLLTYWRVLPVYFWILALALRL